MLSVFYVAGITDNSDDTLVSFGAGFIEFDQSTSLGLNLLYAITTLANDGSGQLTKSQMHTTREVSMQMLASYKTTRNNCSV